MNGSYITINAPAFEITKSYRDENGQMYIEGIAATTGVDLTGERMSPEVLAKMAARLVGKPLRSEHGKGWDDKLGEIVKADVIDEDGNPALWIKARLFDWSTKARDLFKFIAQAGGKMGLSVAGKINPGGLVKQMVDSLGKYVPTYVDVDPTEVSVTDHPANLETFALAVAKSLDLDTYNPNEFSKDVENAHDTKPGKYDDVKSSDFLDPENYKYPADDKHLMPALRYFNQSGQRDAGGYDPEKWASMGSKLASKLTSSTGDKYIYDSDSEKVVREQNKTEKGVNDMTNKGNLVSKVVPADVQSLVKEWNPRAAAELKKDDEPKEEVVVEEPKAEEAATEEPKEEVKEEVVEEPKEEAAKEAAKEEVKEETEKASSSSDSGSGKPGVFSLGSDSSSSDSSDSSSSDSDSSDSDSSDSSSTSLTSSLDSLLSELESSLKELKSLQGHLTSSSSDSDSSGSSSSDSGSSDEGSSDDSTQTSTSKAVKTTEESTTSTESASAQDSNTDDVMRALQTLVTAAKDTANLLKARSGNKPKLAAPKGEASDTSSSDNVSTTSKNNGELISAIKELKKTIEVQQEEIKKIVAEKAEEPKARKGYALAVEKNFTGHNDVSESPADEEMIQKLAKDNEVTFSELHKYRNFGILPEKYATKDNKKE